MPGRLYFAPDCRAASRVVGNTDGCLLATSAGRMDPRRGRCCDLRWSFTRRSRADTDSRCRTCPAASPPGTRSKRRSCPATRRSLAIWGLLMGGEPIPERVPVETHQVMSRHSPDQTREHHPAGARTGDRRPNGRARRSNAVGPAQACSLALRSATWSASQHNELRTCGFPRRPRRSTTGHQSCPSTTIGSRLTRPENRMRTVCRGVLRCRDRTVVSAADCQTYRTAPREA